MVEGRLSEALLFLHSGSLAVDLGFIFTVRFDFHASHVDVLAAGGAPLLEEAGVGKDLQGFDFVEFESLDLWACGHLGLSEWLFSVILEGEICVICLDHSLGFGTFLVIIGLGISLNIEIA